MFYMKERILVKHDVKANWDKAVNFVPLPGELIIYDGVIEGGKYIETPKLKIGDGVHKVFELPFIDAEQAQKEYVYDDESETLEITN